MAATTQNLLIDPTNPDQAQVQGITPPATPQAAPSGIAPVTPAPQVVAGVAPPSSVATPQDLPAMQDTGVASRVAALTAEDSPLMKQARTSGLQLANARGVLNSSIAAGASEDAALRAATPIASQEAAQAQQTNTQRYDLSAAMDRLRAQAGFESQARAEGYSYSAALNQQGYAYQAQQLLNQQKFEKDMAAVQQGYQVDTANLQATLQSKLQSQANDEQIQRMGVDLSNNLKLTAAQGQNALNQIKAQGDTNLTLQANQFQEALKELTLTLNEQNSVAMANASVNLFQAEAQLRASLLANENIPAAERAAYEQQISALTGPTRDYISKVLGYVPTTGEPAAATAPATAAPVTTAPATTAPVGIAPVSTGVQTSNDGAVPDTSVGIGPRLLYEDALDNRRQ
jgi:hypothetical protein